MVFCSPKEANRACDRDQIQCHCVYWLSDEMETESRECECILNLVFGYASISDVFVVDFGWKPSHRSVRFASMAR